MRTTRSWRWRTSIGVALAAVAALAFVPTIAGATAPKAPRAVHTERKSPAVSTGKPTIVLVHGAWADSSSWDGVIPILKHDGYKVDAPPNPLRSLSSDSAYLASYLQTVKGPVVLVGHSYGGAVITNAATGNSAVKALVYVDAFEPADGENLETLTFAKPGSCLAGGGDLKNVFKFGVDPSQPAGDYDLYIKRAPGTDFPGFDACFANDVPTAEAKVLAVIQRPLALDAFTQASGPPAWKTIPSWSLIGTQDHAIPPAELEFMAKRAHAKKIVHVKAGHLSMVSDPKAVAKLIVEAATSS